MNLELRDVFFKRNHLVLDSISFSFEKGRVYGVIGKSGAGKTTLLKILAGLLNPTSGEVYFKGNKLIGPDQKLVPGYEDIQLVNQDFALDMYHTVEENIREKVLSRHYNDQQILVDEFLELVELDQYKTRKAIELSGGEQQRLSIARALSCEPDILLLDEPFAHLDQRLRLKIIHYLKLLNKKRRITIILVSHDGAEMVGFAETIVHLEEGRIARADSTREMYYSPVNREEAELLGLINEIKFDGQKLLFRPTEFEVWHAKDRLNLSFIHAIDTGLVVLNYFSTDSGEEIVLSSGGEVLNDCHGIKIRKNNESK